MSCSVYFMIFFLLGLSAGLAVKMDKKSDKSDKSDKSKKGLENENTK